MGGVGIQESRPTDLADRSLSTRALSNAFREYLITQHNTAPNLSPLHEFYSSLHYKPYTIYPTLHYITNPTPQFITNPIVQFTTL